MEQFEQLLTCAICLDRYRNPKLLPCQHSFCMEPCMDGLVDYVRRQVKCPECRAEHRIPYQGVQGYPTNVTLQRFLELHIEITGELPDPTSGQIMKRCAVCSEKAYCTMCLHCDKEICPECKGAHKDILRREITRITNQIRRALHRLEDIRAYVEKSMLLLQQNGTSVSEEVEELYNRLNKALKDRAQYLRTEIDRYLTTENKHLSSLKENLETEISNIQSNCDLADRYMQNENIEWDDCELMDAKEIFLKTVEFLRYFETEASDYTRKAKFIVPHDPNQLVMHVANFGDLAINTPNQPTFMPAGLVSSPSSANMLQPPGAGLMRSKSDHRLASQFRQQEERGYDGGESCGRVSPLGGRKFGERTPARNATSDRLDARYGRPDRGDYGNDCDQGIDNEGGRSARSRFRSRLAARHANENADSDSDIQGGRTVRFADMHTQNPRERERDRVLDTEDVARGPLSGITRLYDSPRVMKKLQESEIKKVKCEQDLATIQQPAAKFQAPQQQTPQQKRTSTPVQRQVSEDDEISRIKRQNKNATSTAATAVESPVESHRSPPMPDRVSSLRREESRERQSSSPNRASAGSDRSRKTPIQESISSNEESNEEDNDNDNEVDQRSSLQKQRRPSKTTLISTNPRRSSSISSDNISQPGGIVNKVARSTSSDSSASTESSRSVAIRSTGAAFTTDELRKKFLNRIIPSEAHRAASASSPIHEKPKAGPVLQNEDDDEETESSSESEETESEDDKSDEASTAALEKTDIGPLLARSANARDTGSVASTGPSSTYKRTSRDDNSYSTSRFNSAAEPFRPSYGSSKEALSNSRSSSKYSNSRKNEEPEPKTRFTSRFLNKNKSTGMMAPTDEDDYVPPSGRRYSGHDESLYSSRREPAYTSFKDRKLRLARSKSSHGFGEEADAEADDSAPASYYPSSYLASKSSNAGNDLSRSRSSHVLKSRENSPDRPLSTNTGPEKDGSSLSSWARYLKNKYGNRTKDVKENNLPTAASTSAASSASRRLSLGLPLRPNNSASVESSDDDQKNLEGSPNSPIAATALQAGFAEVGTTLRSQYMQKRQLRYKIGSRGSGPGCFTWPRGIAVGPDNSIVVADSSNHRVQIFDQTGRFVKEFGTFGNGEGEFDCLAGIAVNRIGQYIIADRYNHRIQVLDPSGRFLRSFGSLGSADGRFNYPWGITTDALGFIYVCDKENHRIQVFQSDGTFVGKFGSMGNKIGQLEHPHYIAVSNTNRVIVSDSNNHRIQIFDVNGRVLHSIGVEGSANGQFKFPRGVAVDDQGYVLVGDSGNNRIQIFHPDGTFLRSFGSWGSGDGEFKGLEGVAVMSNENILVCDRENHRVQVF